ncbi:MAG TPA: FAD-dependent oxidoreductase [Acidimicrobiales bacterium]|nr:FAD-dependent oxidoreductase [Acidimicrobiales bacterium]
MTDLDLVVCGSGVAGLTAAVRAAAAGLRVGVVTKGEIEQSATRWAQGGVAAVLGGEDDSVDSHLADTLAAGAGLCDVDAVRVLVGEGPARVRELIELGAEFDRGPDGALALAREGGHSHARVVHAGGAATGAEIERALVEAVRATAAVLRESCFLESLIVEGGRCRGVVVDGGTQVRASHVLLATGGAGQLFSVTTNPPESTGDGLAVAMDVGAAVADVEFMQFHPTALHHPAMPRPLLSEALRGHGAVVRDAGGRRFVDELLPRDQVARAITAKALEQGVDHCWLDATGLDHFTERFPTIAASLAAVGLDPSVDWLPIAPAAHYLSGGVLTDLDGATSVPGLWAAGEVACTGVHGANRLASNSLLEGMVWGARVVDAVVAGRDGPQPTGALRAVLDGPQPTGARRAVLGDGGGVPGRSLHVPVPARARAGVSSADEADAADDTDKLLDELQQAMTAGAGVLRSAASLADAAAAIERVAARIPPGATPLGNLTRVAMALVAAAARREESRGNHTRTDFPETSERFWCRLVAR